jgi:uncharacterized damage-inducible protein DinB
MDLLQMLRAQARANRLANRRLHDAMGPLSRDDFHAPRTSFFPSLAQTLNHLLAVDIFYIDALHGVHEMERNWNAFVAADTLGELARRQAASDERLITFCEAMHPASLRAEVTIDRGDRIDRDLAPRVLAHLFMHQTHHRGQAHAMLAGTAVAPPQLDELLLASDAPLRVQDLAALGWSEDVLLGNR